MKNLLKKDGFLDFSSSVLAIIIGLLFGFIIILIANPGNALDGFMTLLTGVLSGGMSDYGKVLYYAVPIIMTGLSVGFAFKTGLFNIGTPGQFIVGAFAAVYIGVNWTFLGPVHWLVALLGAGLAGAVWALVPGLMKAYLNVNEVIASIMMNYIGMYTVNYLVTKTVYDAFKNQSLEVASTAVIPKLGLDKIFTNSPANAGILIAILMVIIIYIVLNKTKLGYEMKACGFNRDASRYAGINEKKNIVLSMAIAGALAGIGGGLSYLAGTGRYIEVVDVLAADGFNGIPVALLGLSNPIGVLLAGLFISYLNVGGFMMQSYGFIPQIVDIIISCIIYFSAFSLMMKVWLSNRANKKRKKDETSKLSGGDQ
ncbi:MAG: ABC transporter permease [Erysipelotrichaceae bacterium]